MNETTHSGGKMVEKYINIVMTCLTDVLLPRDQTRSAVSGLVAPSVHQSDSCCCICQPGQFETFLDKPEFLKRKI